MRRILAAVALSAVALLGAGCTGTGTATPSSSGSASASATRSVSPSADPSAQAICADLKDNILNTDAKAFGAELGKMVSARASGDKAAQAQRSEERRVGKECR